MIWKINDFNILNKALLLHFYLLLLILIVCSFEKFFIDNLHCTFAKVMVMKIIVWM